MQFREEFTGVVKEEKGATFWHAPRLGGAAPDDGPGNNRIEREKDGVNNIDNF